MRVREGKKKKSPGVRNQTNLWKPGIDDRGRPCTPRTTRSEMGKTAPGSALPDEVRPRGGLLVSLQKKAPRLNKRSAPDDKGGIRTPREQTP